MLPEIDSMIISRPANETSGFLNSNASKIVCTITSFDKQQIATSLGMNINSLNTIMFIFENVTTENKDTLVVRFKVSGDKSVYKSSISLRFDAKIGNYEETARIILFNDKSRKNIYKGKDYSTGVSFTVF